MYREELAHESANSAVVETVRSTPTEVRTMAPNKLQVGDVEVLALTDYAGDFPMPLSQLYPTVPADAWEPYRQRYPELFNGPDTWHNHYGCYLLRSQGRTILVDTGLGSKATNPGAVHMFAADADGQLLTELQAAGVHLEDVDTVFFTHLHPDHVGWNLSQGGANPRPTFPSARYVVHETDWATFKQPEVQAATSFSFWDETLAPLETLGVLDLLSGERALTSEITAIPSPGHTPGHMSLAIVSGGERALIMGDVACHPAQVTETEWSMKLDMDQEVAAQVRKKVLDRVEAEDSTLVACHFPEPGFGHLVRVEGRRYWQGL
jgi:glyoxylase-like metal-dependent hydrolase (beta-lactamase superfamily II)